MTTNSFSEDIKASLSAIYVHSVKNLRQLSVFPHSLEECRNFLAALSRFKTEETAQEKLEQFTGREREQLTRPDGTVCSADLGGETDIVIAKIEKWKYALDKGKGIGRLEDQAVAKCTVHHISKTRKYLILFGTRPDSIQMIEIAHICSADHNIRLIANPYYEH